VVFPMATPSKLAQISRSLTRLDRSLDDYFKDGVATSAIMEARKLRWLVEAVDREHRNGMRAKLRVGARRRKP
jgi:hypothetical protein